MEPCFHPHENVIQDQYKQALISQGVCLCRVELRTQEAERGMNSEEAEKLVWAAQTIFATGCKSSALPNQGTLFR